LSSLNIRHTPDAALFDAVLTKPARHLVLFDALAAAMKATRAVPRLANPQLAQFDAELARRWPLRILLAEDNEINRKVALRMLRGFGYQADVAANGLEAIDALRRQPYDLVLMDIQMPEMDGLEAARRIVHAFPTARPRIVAMSANVMPEDTAAALQAGMDDYLVKPISVPLLRDALEKAGELKAARAEAAGAAASRADALALAGVLDDGHLRNFVELDPSCAFLDDLVQSFAASSRQSLSQLGQAMAAGATAQVAAVAHQLKGTSATLGVRELSRLCMALEDMAVAGTLDGAAELVLACEREFETGLRALALLLAAHRQPA
jgi:CheY-like chemotaxis protein